MEAMKAILDELYDRRRWDDVDDALHLEIAEALVKVAMKAAPEGAGEAEPVAWRETTPMCPADLIARALPTEVSPHGRALPLAHGGGE